MYGFHPVECVLAPLIPVPELDLASLESPLFFLGSVEREYLTLVRTRTLLGGVTVRLKAQSELQPGKGLNLVLTPRHRQEFLEPGNLCLTVHWPLRPEPARLPSVTSNPSQE